MSKIKAVVLEKSRTHYNVLGMDGTFRQAKQKSNAEVGDEIEINVGREGFGGIRIWAGVVALFLMVVTSLVGWTIYQAPTAVALVSVNINPSLQFTLDSEARFLKLETQNEDARQMLDQNDLKGKPVDEVLAEIFTMAYNQNFINSEQHWVVVGYSPITNKIMKNVPKEINETQINDWITESMEKKGYTSQVAVFTLTSEDREHAQKRDLTIGEFGLWQTAQKAGVTTKPEKLKETSERVRLLENPQVQALVLAEKQVPDKGVPRSLEKVVEKQRNLDKSINESEEKQMLNESPIERLDSVNEKGGKVRDEKKKPLEKKVRNDNKEENEEEVVEEEEEAEEPEEEDKKDGKEEGKEDGKEERKGPNSYLTRIKILNN